MANFDNIKVGPDMARLQRAYIRQMLTTLDDYKRGACPTGDRSAIERLERYLANQDLGNTGP